MKLKTFPTLILISSLALTLASAKADNTHLLYCFSLPEGTALEIEKNSNYKDAQESAKEQTLGRRNGRLRPSFGYDVQVQKSYPGAAIRRMKYKLKGSTGLAEDFTGTMNLYPIDVSVDHGIDGYAPSRPESGSLKISTCEIDDRCDGLRAVFSEGGLPAIEMFCRP